jgi:hypothetical protein
MNHSGDQAKAEIRAVALEQWDVVRRKAKNTQFPNQGGVADNQVL